MRQVLTLVIKNILVRSPTDVTNKHGWTSAIISAVRHHLRTLCMKGYIERLRPFALSPLTFSLLASFHGNRGGLHGICLNGLWMCMIALHGVCG